MHRQLVDATAGCQRGRRYRGHRIEWLGVRLLNRTNRSVTLTTAGEELFTDLDGPFAAIGSAVEALNRHRGEPAGRIRLNVKENASALLLAPVLPTFIHRYPKIEVRS